MYRNRKAEGAKQYRKSWSPGKKADERRKSCLRMQKSRAKKKKLFEEGGGQLESKRMTRNEIKEQREKWRNSKQKSREKQSAVSIKRELARRRERYTSKRKLLYPDGSPNKFAGDLLQLIKDATPRKKEQLEKLGITTTNSVEKRIVKNLKVSMKEMKHDQSMIGRSYYRNCVRALSRNVADKEVREKLDINVYSWQKSSL